MKKLLIAVMTLVLAIGLCSCGGPSPTEVADTYLKTLQETDPESGDTDMEGEFSEMMESLTDTGIEKVDTRYTELFTKTLLPKILSFEYELSNEAIDGDKATVDANITTYDLGAAVNRSMEDFIEEATVMALTGASEEAIVLKMADLMEENINGAEKTFNGTVSLSLTKEDGKWVLDDDQSDEFYNALLGGAVDAMDQYE